MRIQFVLVFLLAALATLADAQRRRERTCASGQYRCKNGKCIPEIKKCDNIPDCPEGDDEAGCPKRPCRDYEFECEPTACIPLSLRCDGVPQCNNLADETNCPSTCKEYEFQCKDGQCVDQILRCNFRVDCRDGSDEKGCQICTKDEYRCNNGTCININRRCDGKSDCLHGEDEEQCAPCSRNEFRCDNGACINGTRHCDGRYDCSDGSDERNCEATSMENKCSDNEFQCSGGECIADYKRCNGYRDCLSGSDEENCQHPITFPAEITCRTDQFRCGDGSCIQAKYKCDQVTDCPDHSDEMDCDQSPTEVPCGPEDVRCGDGQCVSKELRCNNRFDCVDGADESDCILCSPGQFKCNNGQCIPENKKCNGHPDCEDQSDEHECTTTQCKTNEFRCNDGSCIDNNYRCDGYPDCPDKSDENCAATPTECRENEFRCNDGFCIDSRQKCDEVSDCSDGSDEENCDNTCHPDELMCRNGNCININYRCDGYDDCLDGTDEEGCPQTTTTTESSPRCASHQFECSDRSCISLSQRCDGYPNCPDGGDEHNCPPRICGSHEHDCGDGHCIPKAFVCDRTKHCRDGSDEERCGICDSYESFQCADGMCIPASLRCDNYYDCKDFSDEQNCFGCQPNEFHCVSGECLDQTVKCNGHVDCYDGSDEYNCPTTTTTPHPWVTHAPQHCLAGEFHCSRSGECVPQSARCDGRYDCNDYSDESGCSSSHENNNHGCRRDEFRCENGPCIAQHFRCDGKVDCPRDDSDELDCGYWGHRPPYTGQGQSQGLRLKTYPDDQIIKENVIRQGREVVFQCRDEGPLRAKVRWLRANNLPLPPGSRDFNGRLEMPNIQVEHSGAYICEAIGYAPNTPNSRITVHLTVEPFDVAKPPPSKVCELHEATCSNGDCIPKTLVCDGNFDCTDGSDETRCNQYGCEPNEFRCDNKRCILKTWRCDTDDDCGDGSDERNCGTSPPGSPCRSNEFQCKSGANKCIPRSFHCDLERDCEDGSDEIGCSNVQILIPPPPMVNLEIGDLFEITCKAFGVPTPEVMWRLNWGHIPEKCTTTSVDGIGTLRCANIQEEDQGAYTCEAINIRGQVLAEPDTILTVRRPGRICPPGYFNDEARNPSECISCFCFGATAECKSANLYTYQLHPPFDSHKIIGVKLEPTGNVEIRDEPIYRGTQPRINSFGRSGVQVQTSPYGQAESNIVPYFAMPENYHGNQLKSYGGYLKYNVKFSGTNRPSTAPDVILSGNGYKLVHKAQSISPDREHQMTVRFFYGEWTKRSENAPDQLATREEIMMTLAAVDNILIKLQYHTGQQIDTTISNIEMDSAAIRNTGQGLAHFVEECRCPVGYSGLSCENCAVGYSRHLSGPWLGKCFKEEETCPPGKYGDPARGIPCEVCPCPLTTPSNQFARTCHLGPDNLPICDCPPGYVGRRCEQCAAGYTGNPLIPGDYCRAGVCDASGSTALQPDQYGQCPCKLYTTGSHCNQCKPNKFYLSSSNQFGCIACFCMGVTQQCSSSNWYRDTISSAFTRSRNDFKLVESLKKNEFIEDGIRLDSNKREIVYSDFTRIRPGNYGVYYWALPARYLGDKISSYGGYLNYTLRYVPLHGGQSSINTAPNVEIISSNDIILMYFDKDNTPQASKPQSFSVPLLEQYWQRNDGKTIDREHFLMALADVSSILIKATYTTGTEEVGLISLSMDIADERNTGRERALAVEQCMCPPGYKGLSCEDCDYGYTRADYGLYLAMCEPCNCNGHSSECDPETGVCMNCGDHTTGDHCDECLPGYEGDATKGTPYDCRPTDTGSQTCECNAAGSTSTECRNNQCRCKTNVEGSRCDKCRKGTFGLSTSNPEGCSECYCSGVTDECGASNLFREQIPSLIIGDDHGFTLTDQYQQETIKDNFQTNIALNEIGYNLRPSTNKRLFWSLPSIFTGNQIKSYGGKLEFVQRYTERPGAKHSMDIDVMLSGNGVTVYWTNPERLLPDRANNISVLISASGNNWQRYEHHSGPRRASRDDILTALANLDSILVRASQSTDTVSTYISDITLDTAVPQFTGQTRATQVEECKCPVGYRGTSCEVCSSGYYRDLNDRSAGPLGSCHRCPCNGNEQSCALGNDNRVVCSCLPGYYGERCESTERPTTEPPYEPATPAPPTIEVSISAPTIQIVGIGSTVRLRCEGRSLINSPIQLQWVKDGGVLPRDRAIDDRNGLLIIREVQVSDSGTYICQATDGITHVTGNVTVTVGGNAPEPPRVSFDPPYLQVNEGEPIEIRCMASGNPQPTLDWTGGPNNPDARFYNGIFRIPYARKSDEGQYTCSARNSAGTDTRITHIYVREGYTPPAGGIMTLNINPRQYQGPAGETFTLTCTASPGSVRSLVWSKIGGPIPYSSTQQNGVLTVYSAKPEHSGTYICNGTSLSGTSGTAQVRVSITSEATAPSVHIEPGRQTVVQGTNTELRCIASGTPTPTIKWTKVGEEFGPNVQEAGQYLRIMNTQPKDQGVYICIAHNTAGMTQQHSVIEVERREIPAIEMYPALQQTITSGGTALLQCRIVSGYPQPKIWWTRPNGKQLSQNVEELTGGVLRFNQITMEEDGGYICHAENEAGQTTMTATIDVQTLPVVNIVPHNGVVNVREGERIKLECHASGHPQPTVHWSKHQESYEYGTDRRTEQHMAIYEITSVTRADEGQYICLAQNAAGAAEDRIQLLVDEPESVPTRGDIIGEDPESDKEATSTVTPRFGGTGYPYPPYRPQTPPELEEEFIVPEGARAEMRCKIQSPYGVDVSINWIKSDNTSLPADSYVRGSSLFINNADPSMAGTYTCIGISSAGNVLFTHKAHLKVLAPPRITLSPQRQVVRPGDNARIHCTATGDQPIDIRWTAMDRALPRSVQISGGQLQFYGIQTSDAGRYACIAKNSAGESDAVAEVIVNDHQQTPTISAENKIQHAIVGSTVSLRCNIAEYTPVRPNVRWMRDRHSLPPSAVIRGNILQLVDVQMTDAGRYICETSNEFGTSRDYITLIINHQHREPETAAITIESTNDHPHMSDTIDLHCRTTDQGEIKWSKLSGRFASNVQVYGPTLRIVSMRPENEGYYRCEVSGYQGSHVKDYELVIIDAPLHGDERPVDIRKAPQGSTIVMDCKTALQEPITYQWSKEGGSLPHDTNTETARLQLRDITAKDAGTYICTARDATTTLDVPTVLVVTGIVPFFSQAPNSYIALPTLADSYLHFNFEISFKPETPNGLILYNGHKKNQPSGDFIALVLNDGYPEFRFNVGSGTAVIKGDKRLELGEWHTIKVSRSRRDGKMFVDGMGPYSGQSGGKNQGLDLVENLYIGGVPKFKDISPHTGADSGFVGCISRLVISRVPQDLMRDAIAKNGITTCETCTDNPCQNQGVCQEAQTKEGYSCLCPAGFSGPTCNRVGEACYPDACGTGRCVDKEEGFDCYCPLGKTGKRCERDTTIYEPAFSHNAYIAYPTPNPQRRLKMTLKIKPRQLKDGVLLYCAESEEGFGHFTSVTMKDKHLEFRFDVGNGPAIIRSKKELKENEWVAVTVSRYLSEGKLIVNGEQPVSGRLPGGTKPLSLHTPLYIGGYDEERIKLNSGVGVSGGFEGCVAAIDIAGANLDLIQSVVDSANVQDCSDIDEHLNELNNVNEAQYGHEIKEHHVKPTHRTQINVCSSNPCRNDGQCYPASPTAYTCSCVNGYTGKDCEIAPNQCDQLTPCQNGGTCHGNTTKYHCDCPLGYTGINCEQRADIRSDINFNGDGFLELSKKLLPHENNDESELVAFVISTNQSDGLIFWHGQQKDVDGKGKDFISLAVVGGYLQFSYDLGSGPAVITNDQVRVDDGQRHNVVLKRTELEGSIEVDQDYIEYGRADGITTTMNCNGNIYLGGLPNITLMTGGRFDKGFTGCIHAFEVQDSNTMDLGTKAVAGVNVKPCSSSPDENELDENEDDFVNK